MIETLSTVCNHISPNDQVKLTSLTIFLPPSHFTNTDCIMSTNSRQLYQLEEQNSLVFYFLP